MTKSIRRLPETKVIDKELMDANASISFFGRTHVPRNRVHADSGLGQMSDARGELQLDNAGVNQLYELIRKE